MYWSPEGPRRKEGMKLFCAKGRIYLEFISKKKRSIEKNFYPSQKGF